MRNTAENGIYGAEKSGKSRLICDYSASDISAEEYSFTRIKLLDDGRIVALSRGNSSPDGAICLLTPVPPDDISLKTALTFGVWSPGEELRYAVAAFNKENKIGARIEIKDYSQYDTPSDRLGGITRLNADIVTDNAPDIINISQAMPYYSYCSKGLFADLGEYFGKDGIEPDDYFGNILDFSKVGGKQYSIITQFSFFTFAAKESLVNETLVKTDRFTAGDYLALAAAHPGKAVFSDINRKQFVIYFENYMSAKFIDKETNEPKFGAEFADMLDFIMLLPEKSPYDLQNADNDIASRGEVRLMIQNDEALLSAEIIPSFESYWKTKAGYFGGDMALLGTPGGDGSAVLLVQNELAISSGSARKTECAEFIKFCLSRKRQENITGGFPVNIDAFNAVMKKAYKVRGVDAASTYVVPGGNPVNIGHISCDEAEYLKEYIEGITSVSRPDLTIQQIIGEELSRLISGGETKEECTENIQKRAALYLSEQTG
ncbi:MAG TPA: extracellular solute-binding protein [Clostridiales bacterium]|nr:extracellular solute-binding protein [Clostridiales bacterium]